ncbi:MAG: murein biosynthesis integral membrane protein MurJ [Actinomycetes bacterium]
MSIPGRPGHEPRTSSLARSSAIMAAGTVASRVLGFARSLVFAAAIGTALVADTFNVANTVPNILYILVVGGVLNAVFVPQLVRAAKTSPAAGDAYADRLLTVTAVGMAVITVVATLAAPLVIRLYAGGNWSATDIRVATEFAYWCLPQIFFYGLFTMVGQVLNARGSFGPMMWAPVLNNLVAIAAGIGFLLSITVDPRHPGTVPRLGILLLGAGSTLGVLVQAVALLPVLARTGYRWRPRWDWRGTGLGKAFRLGAWTLAFVAVNQLGYLVVVKLSTAVAKSAEHLLPYGVGFTPYSNAYLIFVLPQSVITLSVVTAILPRMSAAAAEGRYAPVRADLSRALRYTAVVVVPTAVAFWLFGPDLAGLLYAGAGQANARFIGEVLAGFAIGVVPFCAQYVLLRGFYALEDTRTPFLLATLITAVDVVLVVASYLVLPLRLVTVGMAAAYGLAYVVGVLASGRLLSQRLGGLDARRVVRTHVRTGLAGLAAGGVGLFPAAGAHLLLGRGLLGSTAALLAGGAVMIVAYLGLTRVLGVDETAGLLAGVRARVGRGG